MKELFAVKRSKDKGKDALEVAEQIVDACSKANRSFHSQGLQFLMADTTFAYLAAVNDADAVPVCTRLISRFEGLFDSNEAQKRAARESGQGRVIAPGCLMSH